MELSNVCLKPDNGLCHRGGITQRKTNRDCHQRCDVKKNRMMAGNKNEFIFKKINFFRCVLDVFLWNCAIVSFVVDDVCKFVLWRIHLTNELFLQWNRWCGMIQVGSETDR